MAVIMRGNYFFVQPGAKCYKISSNFTNYFLLGIVNIGPYFLEAKIVEDEFAISGKLLNPQGKLSCNVENNFVTSTQNVAKEMTPSGYRLKEEDTGRMLLEMMVIEKGICLIKGIIYNENGNVVAEDKDQDFVIYSGPAIIGKSGNAIGLKID